MGGVVPLSEHEQRQLEQIEQALYREDRRLVRLVRSSDPHVHYRRRVVEALVGLALGAAMVAVGIILPLIGLAAGGFVVLLLCGIWALNSWRQMATVTLGGGAANGPGGNRPPAPFAARPRPAGSRLDDGTVRRALAQATGRRLLGGRSPE